MDTNRDLIYLQIESERLKGPQVYSWVEELHEIKKVVDNLFLKAPINELGKGATT